MQFSYQCRRLAFCTARILIIWIWQNSSSLYDNFWIQHVTRKLGKDVGDKSWNFCLLWKWLLFLYISLVFWVCNNKTLLITLKGSRFPVDVDWLHCPALCYTSEGWLVSTPCAFLPCTYWEASMASITIISEHPANSNEFILASLK